MSNVSLGNPRCCMPQQVSDLGDGCTRMGQIKGIGMPKLVGMGSKLQARGLGYLGNSPAVVGWVDTFAAVGDE